jgi:FKBP-type peptidyl-prolyl cis-trans isomerase
MKNLNMLMTVFVLFVSFHLLVINPLVAEVSVENSISHHQATVKKNPNSISAHCALANAYVDQYISTGKTNKLHLFRAKQAIKKAKAIDAKSALPEISWANYFQAMGNKELALKHAKNAAAIAPENKAVKRLISGMTAGSDVPDATVTDINKSNEELDVTTGQSATDEQLAVCEAHLNANRLTTGTGGTALDCYRAVLKKDPGNKQALSGIDKIARKYVQWIEKAIGQDNEQNARRYIEKLSIVKPGHSKIVSSNKKLDGLSAARRKVKKAHIIESQNFPGFFVNSSAPGQQAGIKLNRGNTSFARWKIVPGLADKLGISFESTEHPGYYLRHRDSKIFLVRYDGSPTFDRNATFYKRKGWADTGKVSFESYNWKRKYIRHYSFRLRIDEVDSSSDVLLKKDATFNLVSTTINRTQTLKNKGLVAGTGNTKAKTKPVTASTPTGVVVGTMAVNTDRYGQDYRYLDLSEPDPGLCRSACNREERCQSWTYVKPGIQASSARCWLKHDVARASPNNCCVSGVKQSTAIQKDTIAKRVEPGHFVCSDVYVGAGEEVKKGDLILMCYSAISKNQQIKFSTFSYISFKKSTCTPVTYRVGSDQMVKGIDLAIQGEKPGDDQFRMRPMRIGGRREIFVRPELAWGKKGIPGRIPADMSFSFTIEIIDILKK